MLDRLLTSLQDTAIATAIREGDGLFPWIESAHVLALTLVIGSIAVVDLRLIGWTSRERSVVQTTGGTLPVTWCAFVAAVLSGGLLFSSNATTYAHNAFFQIKMLLIAGAGLNMLAFHVFLGRGSHAWTTADLTPLVLWIAVVACGRWIGFTLNTLT
jgi:hypothetical protein